MLWVARPVAHQLFENVNGLASMALRRGKIARLHQRAGHPHVAPAQGGLCILIGVRGIPRLRNLQRAAPVGRSGRQVSGASHLGVAQVAADRNQQSGVLRIAGTGTDPDVGTGGRRN